VRAVIFVPPAAAAGCEQLVHFVKGLLGGALSLPFDHDDQVIRVGIFGFGDEQLALGEDILIGLGAHHNSGIKNPGLLGQRALQLHQDHRIIVSASSDVYFYDCHSDSFLSNKKYPNSISWNWDTS
jgi:hypothetical protein